MKIYSEKNIEDNSVEILMNHQELKAMIEMLVNFETKINKYKAENKCTNLGFTHVHFKDSNHIGKKSAVDIVFYVDLDQ